MKNLEPVESVVERYLGLLVAKKTKNPVSHHWVEQALTQDRTNTHKAVVECIKQQVKEIHGESSVFDEFATDAIQKVDEMFGVSKNEHMRCQDCDQEKDDVSTRSCPFAEEIHGETVMVQICDAYEHERAMDI